MTPEQAAQLIELGRLQAELSAHQSDQFAEAVRWLLFGVGGILGVLVADL